MKPVHFKRVIRPIFSVFLLVLVIGSSTLPTFASGDKIRDDNNANPGWSDITGHVAEDDILRAVEYGLLDGYEDGMFRPDDTMTRGQLVTAMYALLQSNRQVLTENGFIYFELIDDQRFYKVKLPYKDVTRGSELFNPLLYTKESVDAMMGKGSFQEVFPGNLFQPFAAITYSEAARILDSFFFFQTDSITSGDTPPDWAQQALSRLAMLQIIDEESKGQYATPLTRGQAASWLVRLSDQLAYYSLLPTYSQTSSYFTYDPEYDLYGPLLFDSYDSNNLSNRDKLYLEVIEKFERGLSDKDSIQVLRDLKRTGYRNQTGVLFYLTYLDGTLSSEERNEMFGQVVVQLSRKSDTPLHEWYAVLTLLQGNAQYAKAFARDVNFRPHVEQALYYLPLNAKETRRLLLAYLAYDDRKQGNDRPALTRYQQVNELSMTHWSLSQLARSYSDLGESRQAVTVFQNLLQQVLNEDRANPLAYSIRMILADLSSMGEQQKAASILDQSYANMSQQEGLRLKQIYMDESFYGTFESTWDFANGINYVTGKYYNEMNLTPKKYEEYGKYSKDSGIVYYFSSDANQWRYSTDTSSNTLSSAIQTFSYTERLRKWNIRYVMKETETHYIIFEYLQGRQLIEQFGNITFDDGALEAVDQYVTRFDIHKGTMLPERESWYSIVQYDSLYAPSEQFGSTYFIDYRPNRVTIPVSVIQQAEEQ